jgi:O-antigen/teichoic acid export membrane protein
MAYSDGPVVGAEPLPVTAEASVTTKNVSTVFLLKIAQYPFLALSVMLIPRMMGPEVYGQYAFLTSIIVIATSLADLGVEAIFGSFVPEFEIRGELSRVNKLFSNVLALKIGIDLVVSSILFSLLFALFGGRFPYTYFLLTILILLVADSGAVPSALLFGLNKLGKYSLREPARRALGMTFVIVLYRIYGLAGAIISILLAELCLAILYFYWARRYLSVANLRIDLGFLKPYLAFGFTFYLCWVVVNLWQRLGNSLIQLVTNDPRQVAFFDMPNQIFLITVTFALSIIPSFAPIFTKLLLSGKEGKLVNWSTLIVKYTGVVCVAAFGGFVIAGRDLIPLIIGRDYVGIFPNGVVLLLGLFPMIFAQLGLALSMAYKEPGKYLKALIYTFLTFVLVAILLVPKYASMGASVATLASCLVFATVMCLGFKDKLLPCLAEGIKVIGLGMVFLSVACIPSFRGSLIINLFLVLCFASVHILSLFAAGILSPGEIRDILQALRYQPKV